MAMLSDCMPPIPAMISGATYGVLGPHAVAVPQVVAVELGTSGGGQGAPVVVEQFALVRLPVGRRHARDKGVGQFAAGMAAPHGLPVQQAGLAVAEVDVAGMRVAVHDGVRWLIDKLCAPHGSSRR